MLPAIGIGIAAVLFFWTQFQAGATNQQNNIDQLPGLIARLGIVEGQVDADDEAIASIRAEIASIRESVALTPDQGQLDRRDGEQTAARIDLEADVDRENDQLRREMSELESDLEMLERALNEVWRAVGALEGGNQ